jgi:hypothetical protein
MKKITAVCIALLFNLSLSAQNTITTDTILQLSTCAGGNVIVPFSTTGTFPVGNVFTAQLSDAFGQFTSPINIGTIPFNTGFIFATIPASTNFGFLYKIRVISSNPAVIGSACPNTLIITQVAQLNQIIATPNDTICQGETVTLSALNPAGSYLWSTGDTTQAITVSQAGNYSVTVTDFLMCQTDTSINITVLPQPCYLELAESDIPTFTLAPNPNSGNFQLNFTENGVEKENITMVNALGQKVDFTIQSNGESSFEVNISTLENGIYYLKISKNQQTSTKRIVKQ